MYIEFNLLEVSFGQLELDLKRWQAQHQINYNLKRLNTRAKLTFSNPDNYTFFCLTWDPKIIDSRKYKIIEPMKIDKTV